jgi:hypothetical protein
MAAVASARRSYLRYEKLPTGPKQEDIQRCIRSQGRSQRNLLSAECMHDRSIYDQAGLQFYVDDVPDRSAMSKSLT